MAVVDAFEVCKVDGNAILPSRGTSKAAGLDISSVEDVVVESRTRGLVSTGLKMRFPCGTYGRLASRSGLSLRHGIEVGAGVIDPDYRGVVKVLLYNHSNENFVIRKGDRIAQLILEKYDDVSPVGFFAVDDVTERGQSGFGSTGK